MARHVTRAVRRGSVAVGLLAAALALGGCLETTPQPETAPVSAPGAGASTKPISVSDRRLARLSPYMAERRLETYAVVQRVYEDVWTRRKSRHLAGVGRTKTFPSLPYLRLEDRDNDGGADFFAYLPRADGGNSQEFGVVFDLNRDGRPDWFAFYGGSAIGEEVLFIWWNQHGVDRNGDGRFDLSIIDLVDRDGNGRAEPDTSAWVFDDDFDGRIDRAEIVRGRTVTPAPVSGRRLMTGHILWPGRGDGPRIGDPMPTELYDIFARDVLEVLAR